MVPAPRHCPPGAPRVPTEVGTWRWLRLALLVLLAGCAWFALAPGQVGGLTTYALVTGHSMEPALPGGSLVVARQRSSYRVGDVVVYEQYGGHVMHRLVGGSAATGWVSQGDNNDVPDSWRVADRAISGAVVLTVPRLGSALRWSCEHPAVPAMVAAALAAMCYLPWHRRRRRRVGTQVAPASAEYGPLQVLTLVATAICFAAVAAGVLVGTPVWPNQAMAYAALAVSAAGYLLASELAEPEPRARHARRRNADARTSIPT